MDVMGAPKQIHGEHEAHAILSDEVFKPLKLTSPKFTILVNLP